jgi:hypothetical protein
MLTRTFIDNHWYKCSSISWVTTPLLLSTFLQPTDSSTQKVDSKSKWSSEFYNSLCHC